MSRDMRRARLQTADCLVLPSREPDQYLLTVQEALQAGAVVIAGQAGGISEVIQSGVNGILVEAGDHAAIDASIRQLHDDPVLATRLRTAAAETARHFDMRFHVAGLSDAYRQLIRASRAGDLDRPAA
jgi:glycosyltransferase involved in cell wall biosynthesis